MTSSPTVGPVRPTYDIERVCDKLGRVADTGLTVQEALFDHDERRELGAGAWIDVRAGWLTHDADDLFEALLTDAPWRAERRQMYDRVLDVPRLVSFHDLLAQPAPHPALARLRVRLNDIYARELGEPFTTAGPLPLPRRERQRGLAR